MSIILSNASRSVTLNQILSYTINKRTEHPVKGIPAKTLPTIHAESRSTTPREYSIRARVDGARRDTILDLENDREVITLNDGDITDNYCFLRDCEFNYDVGRVKEGVVMERPWIANLTLLSSAN